MNSISEAYSKFKQPLLAFIRKRVPTAEIAEDIMQDIFYQFAKATDLLHPIEQVSGWLYRVAKNNIINWRSKKRETMLLDGSNVEEDAIFDEVADILLIEHNTPETEYLRSVIMEEIKMALAELPKEQREVFIAMEYEGLSVKELSANTGISTATLLSRKHYAVLHLRKRLKEFYYEIL